MGISEMTAIEGIGSNFQNSALNGPTKSADGFKFLDFLKDAEHAQSRIDISVNKAVSSPDMKPAELIALQAQVYRSSLELDLASRIVEKLSAGIKQTLNTNS